MMDFDRGVSQVDSVAARQEIVEVLHRYALGLDVHDPAVVASCFHDECTYRLGAETFLGRHAVEGLFQDREKAKRVLGLDVIEQMTHVVSNHTIDLIGDELARVRSLVTVYVIGERDHLAATLMRSVAYDDEFRRLRSRWRVSSRIHTLRWTWEVEDPIRVAH